MEYTLVVEGENRVLELQSDGGEKLSLCEWLSECNGLTCGDSCPFSGDDRQYYYIDAKEHIEDIIYELNRKEGLR